MIGAPVLVRVISLEAGSRRAQRGQRMAAHGRPIARECWGLDPSAWAQLGRKQSNSAKFDMLSCGAVTGSATQLCSVEDRNEKLCWRR